jgi:hypothetical protein
MPGRLHAASRQKRSPDDDAAGVRQSLHDGGAEAPIVEENPFVEIGHFIDGWLAALFVEAVG